MTTETLYLYNGAILEENGDCAMPIPHLFSSATEAQEWADDKGMTVRIIKGVRVGDRLMDASTVPCPQCHGCDKFCTLCDGEKRVSRSQASEYSRQFPERL